VITVGEIKLDTVQRTVYRGHELIRLTPKEFDVLRYMMENAGLAVTHARLLAAVWGPEYGQEMEYLRTFVHQLRRKLHDDAGASQYLLTISHVGYRFRAQVKCSPQELRPLKFPVTVIGTTYQIVQGDRLTACDSVHSRRRNDNQHTVL
jgi:DNA-binding winged helix-turn-helix (wHTH) protein